MYLCECTCHTYLLYDALNRSVQWDRDTCPDVQVNAHVWNRFHAFALRTALEPYAIDRSQSDRSLSSGQAKRT